jgi:hypothetical protein
MALNATNVLSDLVQASSIAVDVGPQASTRISAGERGYNHTSFSTAKMVTAASSSLSDA